MAVDAVLFDLDMTLVDSNAIASYRKAQMWGQVKSEFGRIKPFEIEDGPPPHTLPAEIRKQGVRVGVVTSSPRWYAEAILKTFKIESDCLVCYDDTEEHKPALRRSSAPLKKLGAAPNQDSPYRRRPDRHGSRVSRGRVLDWCRLVPKRVK